MTPKPQHPKDRHTLARSKAATTVRTLSPRPGQTLTRDEIGVLLGLSTQRVAQIEAAAIRKLRVAFGLLRPIKVPSAGKKPNTIYVDDPTPEAREHHEVVKSMLAAGPNSIHRILDI